MLPVVSPDGRRVAWQRFGRRDAVLLRRTRGGRTRRIVRAREIRDVRFSPDGALLAVALRRRLAIYQVATRREVASTRARVRGVAFSPDSSALAFGAARHGDASDLWVLTIAAGTRTRITRDGRSLDPVWGPDGLVFDRLRRRRGDAPAFQLWAVRPDGSGARRITHMRIPRLLSGLVPLDLSADGSRLLAEFEGQDTSVAFAVNPATGRARSLSRLLESGFVGAALSSDGSTVLGMTGGPDPSARHSVATVPFRGGRAHVLVRNAAYPDWTR
jgi:Tol biopolymer transport system component